MEPPRLIQPHPPKHFQKDMTPLHWQQHFNSHESLGYKQGPPNMRQEPLLIDYDVGLFYTIFLDILSQFYHDLP